MKDYKSIEEILDKITTTKEGVRQHFAEIGSPDDNYRSFKSRYNMFKEVTARDLPMFSEEEIIKFHKNYHAFKEIYNWNGFDYMLTILEWENLKDK